MSMSGTGTRGIFIPETPFRNGLVMPKKTWIDGSCI